MAVRCSASDLFKSMLDNDNDDEEVFYNKSKVIDVDVDGDELSQACPFPDSLLF